MNNYSLPSRFLNEISKVEKNTTNIVEDSSSYNLTKNTTSDNIQLSPEKRMLEFLRKKYKMKSHLIKKYLKDNRIDFYLITNNDLHLNEDPNLDLKDI